MDIEFIVQDIFSLCRPQWKLASNIEEAGRAFALAVAQDQKTHGIEKVVEAEESDHDVSSDDGNDDGDNDVPDAEDASSSDEEDIDVRYKRNTSKPHTDTRSGGHKWRWSDICARY